MHTDFSPKPAYTALQRLLALAAQGSPPVVRELDHARRRRRRRRARARPRPRRRDRARGAVAHRQHLGPAREARAHGAPDTVHVKIPAVRGVTVSDPVTGAGPSAAAITDDTVDVALGADPLVLTVTGGRRLGVVPDGDTPFADSGTPATAGRPAGAAARSRTSPACG